MIHLDGRCPTPERNITRPGRLGGDIEWALGLYLVVAGNGTVISISNGWYDSNFCWRPEWDVDFGVPLADANRTGKVRLKLSCLIL